MDEHRTWSEEEFGGASFGDARLTYRLVRMAGRAAERPDGVIARVFDRPAERQAAYDLLGNSRASSRAVIDATCSATAARCIDGEIVYVLIDGSSASLADPSNTKELGSIGAHSFAARGVKVVNVYAVDERGAPVGLLDIEAWRRTNKQKTGSRFIRRRDGKTEMAQHWCPALQRAFARLKAAGRSARAWTVGDRECDDARFLRLAASLGTFTVRAAQNRLVASVRGHKRKLFSVARAGRSQGLRVVRIPATPKRRARIATLETRVARTKVLLPLHDSRRTRDAMLVSVVHVREVGPVRGARLEWILLTNAPVETAKQIEQVVASYRARWRIEEYHRTWKAGACDAEATQVRSMEAITKWITILGAVAARAERLKHLSRTQPDAPASIELTDVEIVSLITAKRRIKTSVEVVPDGMPTIEVATRWIADLGGWAGHYGKYKPGATTIMRGLERLATWTDAVGTLLDPREIKRRLR
jgi:Transposase DNA-binding/Transposase DDE domain